jgi:hypothetical protein
MLPGREPFLARVVKNPNRASAQNSTGRHYEETLLAHPIYLSLESVFRFYLPVFLLGPVPGVNFAAPDCVACGTVAGH